MAPRRREVLHGTAVLLAAGLVGGQSRSALAAAATVHNGPELQAALRIARPGSVIALAPGNYGDGGGEFVLTTDKVTLRGDLRRAVLRTPLAVAGNAVRIEGLAFTDGPRIANRIFGPEKLQITGAGVEVVNCEFFGTRGTAITIFGSARNPHIHANFFHDPTGNPSNPNNNSAIQVGRSMSDTNIRIGALIEDNRFERWQSEAETVSVKSSGNTIRNNVFVACRNLTNRNGEDNVYEGNTLERSEGIVIFDRGNQVLRNQLVGGGSIRVMAGNIPCDVVSQGGFPQACNTFLEGNTGLLVIGAAFSGNRLPALDTTVASHNGRIELRAGLQLRTTLPGGA